MLTESILTILKLKISCSCPILDTSVLRHAKQINITTVKDILESLKCEAKIPLIFLIPLFLLFGDRGAFTIESEFEARLIYGISPEDDRL